MPKTRLTDIGIRNLPVPPAGQITYTDDALAGFGVRVSQGGTRVFVLVHGRNRERVTIGRYPIISLSEARSQAKRILAERTLSSHVAPSIRFKDALDLFISTHCNQHNRASTAAETKRLLNRHFLPPWRHDALADISPQYITKIIDRLIGTPGECNHAFTAARTFFRWAVRRHYLRHNPMEGMQLPTRPGKKDRVLSAEELAAVWRAAVSEGYPYGTILQLLILTGQRRGEIGALRAEYISLREYAISLPPSVVKNNRPHTFPIGPSAARVIQVALQSAAEQRPSASTNFSRGTSSGANQRNVPALKKDDYLFPARGKPDKPLSGWSKFKKAFDQKCITAPWALHDLRRTFATQLASLKVPPHIIERLLNHTFGSLQNLTNGTVSAVAEVYNRHAYMDEMRAAIATWEQHLNSLVNSEHPGLGEKMSAKPQPVKMPRRASARPARVSHPQQRLALSEMVPTPGTTAELIENVDAISTAAGDGDGEVE